MTVMAFERTKSMFVSNEEKEAVAELRQWIKNEADFKPRNEDKFLLMFLRSCDLDQRLTRKTLTKYYQNKVNIPQWFTNRNIMDDYTQELLHHKIHTQCICNYEDQPVIGLSRIAAVDFSQSRIDDCFKVATFIFEYFAQLENCQLNGYVWVFDAKDFSWSTTVTITVLKIAKNFLDTFYIGLPVKVRGIHIFNVSSLFTWFCKTIVCPFLPSSVKDMLHFHEGDLKSLSDFLPAEWLPEELGGCAGPISKHHDVFLEEMQKMNDYFLDDVNFGYCK